MTGETPATNGKDMENLDATGHRQTLFSLLRHVLNVSTEKFDREKASNNDRQKWARIIVAGIDSYGKLLLNLQLEQLDRRLTLLEQEKSKLEEEKP